ncbi:4-oxalocrotonate tautomerase [Bacillus pakistanensis]|uniref:Tautomerase n=1 Tax=Rossellomorea pakistanensis TaxID=992288 RepID=A0ABS2N7L1_9BACI|nr:2-hydroxymuconate tautomerase [Bacillus pakistanensis]MBM7583785.1 4-oxalocrotonate tautomerase [Bacillus pakistanensis]
MPIAHLHILEGRSQEVKSKLILSVTKSISESLGTNPEKIRVLIHEIQKENWGTGGVAKSESPNHY